MEPLNNDIQHDLNDFQLLVHKESELAIQNNISKSNDSLPECNNKQIHMNLECMLEDLDILSNEQVGVENQNSEILVSDTECDLVDQKAQPPIEEFFENLNDQDYPDSSDENKTSPVNSIVENPNHDELPSKDDEQQPTQILHQNTHEQPDEEDETLPMDLRLENRNHDEAQSEEAEAQSIQILEAITQEQPIQLPKCSATFEELNSSPNDEHRRDPTTPGSSDEDETSLINSSLENCNHDKTQSLEVEVQPAEILDPIMHEQFKEVEDQQTISLDASSRQLISDSEQNNEDQTSTNDMPLKSVQADVIQMAKDCFKCGRRVYLAEEVLAMNHSFHKDCFQCTKCNRILSTLNFKVGDGAPYCEAHCQEYSTVNGEDYVRHSDVVANGDSLPEPEYTMNMIAKFEQTKLTPSFPKSAEITKPQKLKDTIFPRPEEKSITSSPETNVDDIKPSLGSAKRLVSLWNNNHVQETNNLNKVAVEEIHYAPNTAKSLAAKFNAGLVDDNSNGDCSFSKVHLNNGSEVKILNGNGDLAEDEFPIRGQARGLIAKFAGSQE